MSLHTMDIDVRNGVAGGTLASLFLAVQIPDLPHAILMAGVGAATSFCTSKILSYLSGKFKRR